MNKQLDWDHAKRICEKYPGCRISAGLDEDWFWTCGEIFDGEKYIKDEHPYVASIWATPVVKVQLPGKTLTLECSKNGDDPDMPKWWGKR